MCKVLDNIGTSTLINLEVIYLYAQFQRNRIIDIALLKSFVLSSFQIEKESQVSTYVRPHDTLKFK